MRLTSRAMGDADFDQAWRAAQEQARELVTMAVRDDPASYRALHDRILSLLGGVGEVDPALVMQALAGTAAAMLQAVAEATGASAEELWERHLATPSEQVQP
ncbi:MAG: hypothetical protein QOH75_3072 [Actinomycetota bacterium]|jgi:hypothetical protein|nr:hypothetical protein [Actinomycetota bacterium]